MDWLISAAGPDGGLRRPDARRRAPRPACRAAELGRSGPRPARQPGRRAPWRPRPRTRAPGGCTWTGRAHARGWSWRPSWRTPSCRQASGPEDRSWRGSEVPSPPWSVSPCCPPSCPVERRVQEVFSSGPPPTPLVDVDPRRDGAASVAVALIAAREAHPTVTSTQSAGLAAAILAQAALDNDEPTTAERAAALIQELHRRPRQRRAGATSSTTASSRCPWRPARSRPAWQTRPRCAT